LSPSLLICWTRQVLWWRAIELDAKTDGQEHDEKVNLVDEVDEIVFLQPGSPSRGCCKYLDQKTRMTKGVLGVCGDSVTKLIESRSRRLPGNWNSK
jgi:hypothetical protein